MIVRAFLCLTVATAAFTIGCSPPATPTDQVPVSSPSAEPDAAGKKYLLDHEPAGIKGIIDLRKAAKDGDEVVVVGKIGGRDDPWYARQAGFTIVDASIPSCLDTGDGCKTPWDYCCTPKEELTRGMVAVKLVDAAGKVVTGDARKLLGLRELNTVVAKGKYRQEGDSFVVHATAVYVRHDANK
jgi:hypothetical protein